MDDVAQQWAGDPDVTEMTDTDLTASRRENQNISDTSRYLHRLAETVMAVNEYPDISWTLDTAIRIELARLIDNDEVSFGRDDFDIKFTIPQKGWLSQQDYDEALLKEEDELENTERNLYFSLPPTVEDMAKRVVFEDKYETITAVVVSGLEVLAGKK